MHRYKGAEGLRKLLCAKPRDEFFYLRVISIDEMRPHKEPRSAALLAGGQEDLSGGKFRHVAVDTIFG